MFGLFILIQIGQTDRSFERFHHVMKLEETKWKRSSRRRGTNRDGSDERSQNRSSEDISRMMTVVRNASDA